MDSFTPHYTKIMFGCPSVMGIRLKQYDLKIRGLYI